MKKSLKKLTLSRETIQTLAQPGLKGLAAGNVNSEDNTRCNGDSGCYVICYWESINSPCPSDQIC
jgi:hypothetical protein